MGCFTGNVAIAAAFAAPRTLVSAALGAAWAPRTAAARAKDIRHAADIGDAALVALEVDMRSGFGHGARLRYPVNGRTIALGLVGFPRTRPNGHANP